MGPLPGCFSNFSIFVPRGDDMDATSAMIKISITILIVFRSLSSNSYSMFKPTSQNTKINIKRLHPNQTKHKHGQHYSSFKSKVCTLLLTSQKQLKIPEANKNTKTSKNANYSYSWVIWDCDIVFFITLEFVGVRKIIIKYIVERKILKITNTGLKLMILDIIN